MPIPSVAISRSDANTGGVKPSTRGICAIIAPSASGTANQAASFARADLVLTEFGHGRMAEFAAYMMPVAKKPIVCIKPDASTVGAYSSITETGAGTMTPAATASTYPVDDFNVLITFVNGGALGTTGITYKTSLDGGKTNSAVTALGTSLIITIANTGISITLGTSTLTVIAAQTIAFTTTAPQATVADLPDALEALRVSSLPWECLLVDGDSDEDTVALLDSWLSDLEEAGKYRFAVVNARRKGVAESEATYLAALAVIRAAGSSLRVVICADAGDVTSPIRGVKLVRPTSLGVAARAMLVDLHVEPAYVADGPLAGYSITDSRSNPKYHDEALFPGVDDIHFTSLRSFDGRSGAYVTNTNLFSADGSDYVYLPHARVMNRASEIVFDILTTQLSAGVRKNATAEASGAVYIFEDDASSIESLVQVALNKELQGRVSGVAFTLSRTDDIGANTGATLTGTLEIESIALVKRFEITTRFVRAITSAAA